MKKNDLHDLVHSLTKSEKRHFKLQCQRQGTDGNYLRIFDILDKQPILDEKALKEAFAGETFAKQLHVTKNYLREKILDSLRSFHSQMSKDAAVKDILKNVEILFYKELYGQAADELRRAESLANDFELHTAQIEVSRWKRKLEQTLHPNRYDRLAEILEEQKQAAAALQNNLEYWETIVRTAQNFMQRSAVAAPLSIFDDPTNAQSLESKVLFFNTLYIKNLREGQQDNAEKALVDLIKVLEAHPARVKEDPISYITTVNNLAGFHVFRNESELALALISRHRKFLENLGLPDTRRPVLKQVVRTTNIELEIFRNADDPAGHEAFFREAEVFVKKLPPKMPSEYLLSFQFQFAWVAFLKKDFDNALSWLNQPLNDWRKNSGHAVFRYLLLLNLMVHCERRNLFVLRYFVESARRQFQKSGEMRPFEKELLHFFAKIGEVPLSEHKLLYRDLRKRLFPENGEPMVPAEVLRMIDFGKWLKS
ncbi:MAG: hypothetical protein K9J37_21735 [Saprospiraceae bacterium]|nr:hypothetical protein [Saprospiraceae bacterium]MCF8252543.1 hypothetical protein [Saprospiraceae bacterium]MCF8282584.1 hypothetical protein [Bacteroidales bacterium]MCF8310790.1 hypothetical protein [Saprospiraceae bacterium]MCF8439380.1 hypothetical protein [Saprospiraceae bacterium]